MTGSRRRVATEGAATGSFALSLPLPFAVVSALLGGERFGADGDGTISLSRALRIIRRADFASTKVVSLATSWEV